MNDAGIGREPALHTALKDCLIDELREALRAREEFVAIAAHELRNPMTPILLQVESLVTALRCPDRCTPEFLGSRLEILATAVREFVRRSTVLLDVSRIAAGNLRIEPARIDASAVVRGIVERAEFAARMARCSLEAVIEDGVMATLDRLALEQVAENLLSNAIKFGAGRPVIVTLCSSGDAMRLTVLDNGIGISKEDRERIFGRFERAVTRREHGGFGIGLWFANQLVAAMRGTIAIESVPGAGTTFIVTLPRGGREPQETSAA